MEGPDWRKEDYEAMRVLDRARTSGRRRLLLFIGIIVLVMLIKIALGSGTISVNTEHLDTQLGVIGLDGAVHTLIYEETESVELREDLKTFDRGERLSGRETRSVCSGTYRNGEYGTYELYAMKQMNCLIVARTQSGVMAFNYESDEATRALYENIILQRPELR